MPGVSYLSRWQAAPGLQIGRLIAVGIPSAVVFSGCSLLKKGARGLGKVCIPPMAALILFLAVCGAQMAHAAGGESCTAGDGVSGPYDATGARFFDGSIGVLLAGRAESARAVRSSIQAPMHTHAHAWIPTCFCAHILSWLCHLTLMVQACTTSPDLRDRFSSVTTP